MDWGIAATFMRYGDEWRHQRRLFHRYLNNTAVSMFQPEEKKATHELLNRLAREPEDFLGHIRL